MQGYIKDDCVLFQVRDIADAPLGVNQQPVHVGHKHPGVNPPGVEDLAVDPDVNQHPAGVEHPADQVQQSACLVQEKSPPPN